MIDGLVKLAGFEKVRKCIFKNYVWFFQLRMTNNKYIIYYERTRQNTWEYLQTNK